MANEKDEDKKAFSSTELASEITKAKAKRTFLEKELHTLETQIYNLETSYLSDTSHIGNLVKGWSGYLSNRSAPPITKKQRFKDSDRIFSLSSVDAVEVCSFFSVLLRCLDYSFDLLTMVPEYRIQYEFTRQEKIKEEVTPLSDY